MNDLIIALGWAGVYAPVALGAIGSIIGCATAGQAAIGAMLDTESGYGRYVGISAMPSSQIIYGIVVMFTLNRPMTVENASSAFGVGILAGLALPIADEAPRIVLLFDLPVDAVLRDAIRVVTIDGGGIYKLGDDTLDKLGITESQRFPVLEYVPPVSFIGKQAVAIFLFELDGKLIPGPTRVAMTAAERYRQVFVAEPLQLGVGIFFDSRQQLREVHLLGQPVDEVPIAFVHFAIEIPDRRGKVA